MFKKDDVTTTRPASTSLLTIDSEDRFRDYDDQIAVGDPLNSSPYNFTYRKPESLMNGFLTRLAVSEIVFPFTIPNINVKTNQIAVGYTVGGVDTQVLVTIPIGFYLPSDLASAVQVAVRAVNSSLATFTMTYGGITTNPNVPRFFYNLPQGAGVATAVWFQPLPYNSQYYGYGPQTKQLFNVLGMSAVNTVTGTAGGTYSGFTDFTLCQYTRYIDIVCPQLTYNQALKDTSSQSVVRDSLCRVYLDQVSGGFQANTKKASDATFCPAGCVPFTIYHNFTLPKQISWTPNQPVPGYLQFQVYDDAGDILTESISTSVFNSIPVVSLDSGYTDWSMTLLVTEN